MRTKLTFEKPGDIEATLTITMKVKDWEDLAKQLSRSFPSWRLSLAIESLLQKANATLLDPPDVEA